MKECGKCGSTSLNDLGHGLSEGTIICNKCDAHWWKKWYTRAEWDVWIEDNERCRHCMDSDINWKFNHTDGLCHDCWRKLNPEHSCDLCIHVKLWLGDDGECCIKCLAGVEWPLDAYEPEVAKTKICPLRKEKTDEQGS